MARILIIGGGVSGLSAGIYAQLSGHQAVICEKNHIVGGNLTGWQRGEYHIDNCIHWLTGTNPNSSTYKLWEELGVLGGIDIFQPDSLYTCEYKGERLSLYKDINRLEKEMLLKSATDKKEIISFISAIKAMQALCGIGGEAHNHKASRGELFASLPLILKYHKLSTGELSQRFTSPLIQRFISCFIGNDFSSLALICVFAHFCGENGGIPKGSSLAMAMRMANRFKELGGEILTDKEAVRIFHEGNRAYSVTFKDGSSYFADYIILTTDPKMTFEKLFDLPIPKSIDALYQNKRLFRFSSYHCAFACDTDKLPFTGDYSFEIPFKYRARLKASYLTIREFSHEKSFAPKDKSIIQAIVFCNEESSLEFIKLKENQEAYSELKKELSAIIEKIIIGQLPQLNSKLECIDCWTPATYKKFVNSEIGSYMSFAFGPRYLPLRASNRISGLNNVILATQWQQVPGGLPIAASGGKLAIETVNKLEKQRKRKRTKNTDLVGINN
ncbi:MAG: NAD(P)/FAD-dependent oxidoreductase [Ruminococcaceae bacterium]|nr:NAD(P)/FAD-dependent oxidoreductase [Oscillospiraceae bacterium]